jgi:hypothetical protein
MLTKGTIPPSYGHPPYQGRAVSFSKMSFKSKKFRPKGRGMENVLLANPWFPLQAYIFRPKGRGITPKLLLKPYLAKFSGDFSE